MQPADTPAPSARLHRLVRSLLLVGADLAPDTHLRRKTVQINVGSVFALIAMAVFMAAFLVIGHAPLIRSGWLQAPLVISLFLLVRALHRRGRLTLARHVLFMGLTIDILVALVFVQGTAITIQGYFLMLALACTIMFPRQEWRGGLVHAGVNLGLFVFFQIHGWTGDPGMADLSPLTVSALRTFMVVSCVIITGALALVSEMSAWNNERELEALANTDALTQLPNRRAFRVQVERQLSRMRLQRDLLFVAVLDIDHFKAVNDNHGHDAGDAVLQGVAQCLRAELRASDTLARIGGEEFALLLTGSTSDQVRLIAERMRQAVAEHAFTWQGRALALTVSIGVAAVRGAEQFDGALKSADTALYQAKASGRNRVQLESPSTEVGRT